MDIIDCVPSSNLLSDDGYILSQIRKAVSDSVRKIRNEKIVPDFSLDSRCSNTELYDANATWLKCLQSPSIWMFYVPIIAIGVVIVSLKFVGVI